MWAGAELEHPVSRAPDATLEIDAKRPTSNCAFALFAGFGPGIEPQSWRMQWHAWRDAHAALLRAASLAVEMQHRLLRPEPEHRPASGKHRQTRRRMQMSADDMMRRDDFRGVPEREAGVVHGRPQHPFSLYTGGMPIEITKDEDFVACVDSEVVASFPSRAARSGTPPKTG